MIQLKTYIHTEDPEFKSGVPHELESDIQTALRAANQALINLEHIKKDSVETIELNIMNDSQIQIVNKDMRDKDKPTDVISLRLSKEGEGEFGSIIHGVDTKHGAVFGEIFISTETCRAQAKDVENTFNEEFIFLLIHGILHIFGYDHMTKEEEHVMMSLAYRILGRKPFTG